MCLLYLSLYGCGQIIELNSSLCLRRRHCYCRPSRRRWRTMLPYWRATQGGPIRRTFSVNNRRTIGGQYWLYRLYYPLCVSRRIDTWQIVYLSYNDPCRTISNHKRYIHVPWVHPWPVPIQRANAHGHESCTSSSNVRTSHWDIDIQYCIYLSIPHL